MIRRPVRSALASGTKKVVGHLPGRTERYGFRDDDRVRIATALVTRDLVQRGGHEVAIAQFHGGGETESANANGHRDAIISEDRL
jgi:hypothetical protein